MPRAKRDVQHADVKLLTILERVDPKTLVGPIAVAAGALVLISGHHRPVHHGGIEVEEKRRAGLNPAVDELESRRKYVQPVHPHPHQGPLDVTLRVDTEIIAKCQVPVSAPLLFTANDCLDIGVCPGSPVSMDYYERAPFPFEGHINRIHVAYT